MQASSVRGFLDQLLTQGKDLAVRGEDMAARQLGVGDSEDERRRMRNSALAGGATVGVLGLLMGSRSARRLAMLGGAGVLGKLAWDAYRGRSEPQAPQVAELEGPAAEARAIALTRAVIAAAKADGHIDATERAHIDAALGKLPAAVGALLREELDRPLDAAAIARLADSDQAAREIYLASLVVTGDDSLAETQYLDALAKALGLSAETIADLRAGVGA